ncbi:hypothetical protein CDIMF43_300013 [Carnobacterium divergens]|nr:hypothetical protein CDIMF43_300013 [Carnobacterium divergens]
MRVDGRAKSSTRKIALKSSPHLQELTITRFDNVPLIVYQLTNNHKE